MSSTYYPLCNICKSGKLIPVNLGKEGERSVKYRCTNVKCNIRFDEYGYEIFDTEKQEWKRLTQA